MELFKINESFWSLTQNGQKISYELSSVKFPFGLERNFNHYLLKIELSPDIETQITNLEEEILSIAKEALEDDKLTIKSQIQLGRNNYPNLLISKIYMKKKQILTKVLHNNPSEHLTIFDIQKNADSIILFIDNLFIRNKVIYYKWKILSMRINK